MSKWKDFENEMTSYLQEMLDNYNTIVKQYGNSDSTVSDIEIFSNSKKFFVEVKMPVSQSSQFVVEIQDNKFVYGSKNKYVSDKYSDEIVKILNDNFELYRKVNKKCFVIPVSSLVSFGWVISNMKNKNVEFIISVDKSNNQIIIPVDKISEIFNIKTILRRKKSGSRRLPKAYYDDFKEQLKIKFSEYKYNLYFENKRLFLYLPVNLSRNECYLSSDLLSNGQSYFLSNKGNYKYEVKMTSVTNNPNIIFELSLKDNIDYDMFTIQMLIDYLNKD